MAQSPGEFAELAAGSDYLKSWDALGALLAQGRSFSGRERNCAFLNLGDAARRLTSGRADSPDEPDTSDQSGKSASTLPAFACASGALGLDQIDDSRSIIPVDWDGDGDLDLWYANRTGPRLRFLRNEMPPGTGWIALKLEGRSCNRDAIGARVELELTGPDGRVRMLWRRLRAGDGFLSQTPKILHFGFNADETISRLVVRWPAPASREETITGLEPGRIHSIIEGTGAHPVVAGVAQVPLTPGAAQPGNSSEQVRVALVNRLPVPKLEYVDFAARPQSLGGAEAAQPTLVLLWASWCAPCLKELGGLAAQAAELKAGNLRVVALSVDTASPNASPADLAAARKAIAAVGWPFESGVTHEGTLRALALIETRALYPERPLPLPSAYLLDPGSRLAVVYHGPVEAQQLVRDAVVAARPPETLEAMKAAVFPFPGRDARPLFPLGPAAVAQSLRDAGYRDDARAELERQLSAHEREPSPEPARIAAAAAICWRLADLEDEAGRTDQAVVAYRKALALTPDQAPLHLAFAATLWRAKRTAEAETAFAQARALAQGASSFDNEIGKVWQTLGEHAKARDAFARAVAAAPGDLVSRFNLAVAHQLGGDPARAIAEYEVILTRKPNLPDAVSNLAWVLATTKTAKLRQPARALELAGKAGTLTRGQSPALMDTLAAAQAATGDFAAASTTAEAALALARAMGETSLAGDIGKHLARYREGKPWIE